MSTFYQDLRLHFLTDKDDPIAFGEIKMKFPLGRLVITSNTMNTLNQSDWLDGLSKHIKCDWGVLGEEDWDLNDWSLANGERIFSAYADSTGAKYWTITERDRSYTTILRPEDY